MVNDDNNGDGAADEDGASAVPALEAQLLQGIDDLKAGDVERAINLFSMVALHARAGDLPLMEASACGMLAQALLLTGRADEGTPYATRALEIAEEVGNEEAAANFRDLLRALASADEEGEAGDGEGGGDDEEGGEEEDDDALSELNARIKAAMDQAMVGDPAGALEDLIAIAEEAQRTAAPGPEASAQIAIGQLLLASGNADLAAVSLQRALTIAEGLENAAAAAHIREILGRIQQ